MKLKPTKEVWLPMKKHFIMKMFVLFCCTFSFALHTEEGFSQNKSIFIKENASYSVEQIFDLVKSQTDYNFAYRADVFKELPAINLEAGAIRLSSLLKKSLWPAYDYEFDELNNSIIIVPNQQKTTPTQEKRKLSGHITDVDGEPLLGVTVFVADREIGTFSNEEGYYEINVIEGETLKYSYVGFSAIEIIIGNQETFNITMEEATSQLDEVQITAYGKTSKRLSTGNITTITAEQIKRSPVVNVLQAIKNTVPGVYIEQPSGQAGGAFNIKIRGQNTLSTTAQPLLIVDGVAMPIGNLPQVNNIPGFQTANIGGSGLNYIDPNNIESINFLKDAEATSIYESRGSNGVILITLKKGKKGNPRLSINSRNGLSFQGRSPKLLGTEDYIQYRTEALENGFDDPSFYPETNGTFDPNRYTNFAEYFANEPATTSQTSVSYSGGSDLTNYLITANYNRDKDMYSAKGANSMGGLHFSLNTSNSNRKFNVGLTGTYSSTLNTVIGFDIGGLLIAPHTPDFYNEDGTLNWTDFDDFSYANYERVNEQINENKVNNLVANLNLKYRPLKGLEISTNLGYSEISSSQLFASPTTYFPPNLGYQNTSTLNKYTIRTITAEPNISYNTELGSFGNLKVKTGATLQDARTDKLDVFATDLLSDSSLRNPTLADRDNVSIGAYNLTGRYLGFFGLLNYNYANKYLVNGSVRYEGSTKFGPNNRFGTFWSTSGAWILSEENWFKDNIKAVSFAKVRASYGTTGGDNIADFSFRNTYTTAFYYGFEPSYLASGPGNPALQWENNKKFEISGTIGLFNDRIQLSDSFYNTISNDQLLGYPSSVVSGIENLQINTPAELRNWGHEITLSTKNILKNNFSWTTDFNITIGKNELVSFPRELPNTYPNYIVGESIQGTRVYDYRGVSPETGQHTYWRDLNDNNIEDEGEVDAWSFELDFQKDRTKFVDLAPIYFGSLNNNFTLGDFNLGVQFTFTKRQTVSFLGSLIEGLGKVNIPQSVFDARWQNPGDITNIPRIDANDFYGPFNYSASSGAFQETFFARLQNLSLSYNVPSAFLAKNHIKSLQFNLQGQNLLLLTDYEGFDPETVTAGVPPLTTVVLGIDISL